MKNWALYIIFLTVISQRVLACGPYYPYGDDVRYNLLKPEYLSMKGFDPFHYSAYDYANVNDKKPIEQLAEEDENVQLWFDYFEGKFDKKSIYEVVYQLNPKSLKNGKHKNPLVKVLNTSSYSPVLSYILFAKKCSPLNSFYTDPWEREKVVESPIRKKFIATALKYANKSSDQTLKKRYAYLAIRMAFYSSNGAKVNSIYDHFFSKSDDLNALDYWALHFSNFFREKGPERNVSIARVFANSTEKRFASHFLYDSEYAIESVIAACKNNREISDVYLIYLSRQTEPSLKELKEFTKLEPTKAGLEFLTLREINKLEDWILTPYYSLFNPSMNSNYEVYQDFEHVKDRVKLDRQYAKQVSDWMQSVELSQIKNIEWWNLMNQYVRFLASDFSEKDMNQLEVEAKKTDVNPTLRFNKSLFVLEMVSVKKNLALNDPLVQTILQDESKLENNKLIFALARELEYSGFTTDAACLMSTLNPNKNWYEGSQFWRTPKGHTTLYSDFYDNYFFYLDAYYEIDEVKSLIREVEQSENESDFSKWKFKQVKIDLPRLYDLVGTKYMREDKLPEALRYFEKVQDTLWNSNHYYYKNYLDANPFYADFYSEHVPTAGDTIVYTKPEITRKLIYYLNKAEVQEGDKKSYCYFQAANCYFNMTQYGNSWMMKRYFWTANANYTGLKDDSDYFKCLKAQEFFRKAKNAAKNEYFGALSLRMLARCKSYELYDEARESYYDYDRDLNAEIFNANPFFQELKQDYPDHYTPLIENCESFVNYYGLVRL